MPNPRQKTTGYRTKFGEMLHGKIEDALKGPRLTRSRGKVNLILTSPPFPLLHKKSYGNETGDAYVSWLTDLATPLCDLLAEDGSIVIEIGNAWVSGAPVMSTLPLEALLAFKNAAKLNLCQHVICHNPARLPSPAVWVTVKRIRLKDSFTHVWWMSKSQTPKADNQRVLNPYSIPMKKLIERQSYNSGTRPSGHRVSADGFLKDHGGSISANVLSGRNGDYPESLLRYTGTSWDARYSKHCKDASLPPHPARMQASLSAFFVSFLTDPGDTVFDPFAGSNTTGAVSEELGRKWIGVEAESNYVEGSKGRFDFVEEGSSFSRKIVKSIRVRPERRSGGRAEK